VIHVREDLSPAGMIAGFLTLDLALDECARLNAQEDERHRREETPTQSGQPADDNDQIKITASAGGRNKKPKSYKSEQARRLGRPVISG
jgi:hypothetical protein